MDNQQPDLDEIRARLAQTQNSRQFWRSLDELADTEAFRELVNREFPRNFAAAIQSATDPVTTRRTFLKLMGAALVMTGVTGCAPQQPREQILPYVVAPEGVIPGKPLFFATAMPLSGYANGVLVESHMGRPTKIEGNPDHPASLGATNTFMQGAIFNLYDPDRAQVVTRRGQINTWETFVREMDERLRALEATGGAGLHLLTETITSPTFASQIAQLQGRFPQARWHQYEPVNRDNGRAGAELAFGRAVDPVYHFDQAQRILSLDADFLFSLPGSVRYAHDFGVGRRVWNQTPSQQHNGAQEPLGDVAMNRLYVIESTLTITGAKADHRLAVRAGHVETMARALAQALGVQIDGLDALDSLPDVHRLWVETAAQDLTEHAGASLVLAGEQQPPAVHALAHAINQHLASVGTTVTYIAPVGIHPVNQLESLAALVEDMAAGNVDTLMLLDCNPVLNAPSDFDLADLLPQVNFKVQLSFYEDETTPYCDWHIPSVHFLESWSDIRAYDGTASIIQPLIQPLFQGRSLHDLLSIMLGQPTGSSSYDIVRAHWENFYNGLPDPPQENGELFWRTALHEGVVEGTASPPLEVALQLESLPPQSMPEAGLELNFRPDSSIWDGRFANNAWLQELPRQITLLTWDNAALLSPATAQRLGVNSEELLELHIGGRMLTAAAWVLPGQPDDCVTLHLGYGRGGQQVISDGLGFNAYALRTADALWFADGLEIRPTRQSYRLASVQNHDYLEGRDHVRTASLEHFLQDPGFAQHPHHGAVHPAEAEIENGATGTGEDVLQDHPPVTLYPEYEYDGYAWAMAIDLTSCIGCNACTIACQVENNIPTVGKDNVLIGREMHWLKVDRYYTGPVDQPQAHFQPRPCMHCEKAPCEPVCPVAATVHDHEGLNQMIYNRCVGTRYCSNNCPYKVRRFNFYNYNVDDSLLLRMWRNPDVTVRELGVMEKCTYCVQRINHARIETRKRNTTIQDGELLTACQQACPTQAIRFGDMNDSQSVVSQMKARPLNYGMLAELGTQPRTTYLAEVSNPNPTLEAQGL